MRLLTPTTTLLLTTTTLTGALLFPSLPDLQPFFAALPISLSDYIPPTLTNTTETSPLSPAITPAPTLPHEHLRRQNGNPCPASFNQCTNLNAPGLCCAPNAVCSADNAGRVACCPSGYSCSGNVNGVITAGTVNSIGVVQGGGGGMVSATQMGPTTSFQSTGQTTGGNNGGGSGQQSTIQGGGGAIVAGGSTVATPGAGSRGAEVPFVARALLRVLEFLPLI